MDISKNGGKVAVGGPGDSAAFQEESTKAVCKISVINGEVLSISLKDFYRLIVSDTATYNYKK